MTFRIEVFKGHETAPYIQKLAEMRLKEFAQFPYLYKGTLEDELPYINVYTQEPQAILVSAFQGNELVGLFSGMPLETFAPFVKSWADKMKEEGFETQKFFYAGELMIESHFRKQGLGSQLMNRLIQEAKQMGFKAMMCVTSIRSLNHPLRPKAYFDSDTIWGKYGLVKTPIVFTAPYPTHQADGTVKTEQNELACWIKQWDDIPD